MSTAKTETKTEKHETKGEHAEGHRDSLGQANPAVDLEKKNIAAANERTEKALKDAEKSEKS